MKERRRVLFFRTAQDQIVLPLSSFTGSIEHVQYARECKFWNFVKKMHLQAKYGWHVLVWFNFLRPSQQLWLCWDHTLTSTAIVYVLSFPGAFKYRISLIFRNFEGGYKLAEAVAGACMYGTWGCGFSNYRIYRVTYSARKPQNWTPTVKLFGVSWI